MHIRSRHALFVSVLFVGCLGPETGTEGSGMPGGGGGGGGAVTCDTGVPAGIGYMDHWREMVALYCGIHPDQQDDADASQSLCLATFMAAGLSTQAHIQQGSACFDQGAAQSCLATLNTYVDADGALKADCDLTEAERAEQESLFMAGFCARFVQGQLDAGGVCGQDDGQGGVTETDTVCRGAMRCIENVCAPALQSGDLCQSSDDCDAGLYCAVDMMGAERFCRSQLALGEDCREYPGSAGLTPADGACQSGQCDPQDLVCVEQCQ
tara:strand:- start:341 stop:1141 length:801 start_codon:yes stop_codon:yes gene_type:complete